MKNIYKQGKVLKSTERVSSASLYIMVLEDAAYNLTSTDDQFSAVVISEEGMRYKVGEVANNWNKGSWELEGDTVAIRQK